MSGHSKWNTIKRKKSLTDAKRGASFTKIIREIIVAAKSGGDPASNARLRTVIEKARAVNMPQDNIKKAVQKGTGELPGVVYEEITYEGYGPGGVALLINVTTDNKNRSAANLRQILSNHGGSMASQNAVAWQFEQKGYIAVPKEAISEDAVYDIITEPSAFEGVKKALDTKKVTYTAAEVTMVPKNYVKLDDKASESMLKLMSELDDDEDVSNVYANFDIPQEVMDKLSGE
jgi:transcriptional/translational regulatory protein YebC/TACO1